MSAANVVIVESPAKAKTINKYLGPDFEVLASFGHVRDLSPKDGSVRPDEDFALVWEPSERSDKPLREIARAVKGAKALYLATDPDREGEAISWHIREVLADKNLLKGREIHRVTFNEITKSAVQDAFRQPRDIDAALVDAYLARRALDYLVGFTISPVLWRKLPGAKSAGRVQSVALRLICDRESEIEKFLAQEYWTVVARLHTPDGAPFTARLTHLAGNKLGKLDITSEEAAHAAEARIRAKALSIRKIEKKQVRRHPSPPFITSTLQQEASRKLGFSASRTMRLAQRLYEGVDIGGETVGLITYMRTDGTTLSQDAIAQCRSLIGKDYGKEYLPDAPRMYKTKAKNAQEAHEAIRPTDISRKPESVARYLEPDMAALYALIWKRTVACQMERAVMDQVTADISDGTDDVVLRAVGTTIAFPGFITLYREDRDDEDEDEENRRLPPMNENDATRLQDVVTEQHFTEPPPRYSEASLVKKLEELGIGRPSTYASILQVLQDRNYVVLDKKRFVPEDRGRLVTAFLVHFFGRYVDYDFTAGLEDELDAISAGQEDWKAALRAFWDGFAKAVEDTKGLTITQVLDHLDAELGPHFFPVVEEGRDPRSCPACGEGRLSLKLGKFGAFIGCSRYPECRHTRPLAVQTEGEAGEAAASADNGPKELGTDPDTGRAVSLRRGPYGPYVQIDPPPETKDKPKRQSLPRGTKPEDVTLELALRLLALPRTVGKHPETGDVIEANIGRFGPYLKYQGKFRSIPKDDNVLEIGLNRAVSILAEPVPERKGRSKPAAKPEKKPKEKAAAKPAKKAASKAKTPAKKTTTAAAKKTAKPSTRKKTG